MSVPIIDVSTQHLLPWEACEAPFGMAIADGVIDEEHCKQVLDWLESSGQFNRSMIMGKSNEGEVDDHRTSDTVVFPFIAYDLPDFASRMNAEVYKALRDYAGAVGYDFYEVEPVNVQRYREGQKYDLHFDYGPKHPRVYSALLYLNKPQAGGNTYFPFQQVEVIPEPGRLVVFPSNPFWKHAAMEVTKGVKYAAAYWALG